jgi:hypothetical protein
LVTGIEVAELPLEPVDFFESKFAFPEGFDAFHDVEQPATGFERFIPKKERLLPFLKNNFLRANDAVLDDVNFAGFRHLPDQDV